MAKEESCQSKPPAIFSLFQNPVSEGEVGEIFVAGQGLAAGYIGSHSHLNAFIENRFQVPEGHKKEDHSRLYRTGDYGKVVNGRVYYEGRQDMQVS